MTRQDTEAEILTDQHPFKRIDLNFDLEARQKEFERKMGGKRVNWEFEEIGLELENWFGRKLYWIFYRPWGEVGKVKEALKVCQAKKIKDVRYLLAILTPKAGK
jgi:hypothetical protein